MVGRRVNIQMTSAVGLEPVKDTSKTVYNAKVCIRTRGVGIRAETVIYIEMDHSLFKVTHHAT